MKVCENRLQLRLHLYVYPTSEVSELYFRKLRIDWPHATWKQKIEIIKNTNRNNRKNKMKTLSISNWIRMIICKTFQFIIILSLPEGTNWMTHQNQNQNRSFRKLRLSWFDNELKWQCAYKAFSGKRRRFMNGVRLLAQTRGIIMRVCCAFPRTARLISFSQLIGNQQAENRMSKDVATWALVHSQSPTIIPAARSDDVRL